ncbi:MAG: hypothetical protein CMJ27_12425 [Phycisphaerae bacterium]|nr:hypothetical protein [Phycisphaerae bacterium]OUX00168.1 MAG: hypothetical protein CBD91_07350 [Phycisphaeraceae bacterium TMED231]
MNRLRSTSFLLIALLAILGGDSVLSATPPKGEESVSGSKGGDAGNPARAAGSTKRTVDPIRSGVSEVGWLDALRHVQVTELQAPLITRMVRAYLDQSRIWRASMGLELDMVVAEVRRIREAGGDIPPELTTRVRMIRGAMPKWGGTQKAIIAELTPTQVESLLLEIDRVKAKQRAERAAENRRRGTRDSKKTKSDGDAGRAAGGSTAVGASAVDAKPASPKPWSFVQAEQPTPPDSSGESETGERTEG